MNFARRLAAVAVVLAVAGALSACATGPSLKDYTAFRAADPHSILVVPVLNDTVNVRAPDYFLSTISRPFAERGYYVFPAHMIERLLQDDGLSDAGLVHHADARRLGRLFGCDSVLLIDIERWDSRYVILKTVTTVDFDYELKSCKTNDVLWKDHQHLAYSPSGSSSGSLLADLIADAVVAAIEKGAPNYMPLTVQANQLAAATVGQGLPAGPYLPEQYKRDGGRFPSLSRR